MNDRERQAIAYNVVILMISLFVIMISFSLTREIIVERMDHDNALRDFFRGSFVYLSPCGLEAMALLTTKVSKGKSVEYIDIALGILSIILSMYLLYSLVMSDYAMPVDLVLALLLAYPIRISINLIDYIILLLMNRGN